MSMGVVLQMVQQNDDKHEKGHGRLRDDYREMEKRVMALERAATDTLLDFARTKADIEAKAKSDDEKAKAGVDIVRIRMSLPLVATICIAVVAVAGAAWSSAAWVKSDISQIRSEMTVSTKLQEERAGTTKTALDKLDAKSTLQQMKIDEITTALKVRGIIKP